MAADSRTDRNIRSLFTRTTSDGVTIRAAEHILPPGGGGCGSPTSPDTYGYELCGRPEGAVFLRVEIAGRAWTAREGGDSAALTKAPADRFIAVLGEQFVDPGEDRGSFTLIKVRHNVATVRTRFDAGGTDQMKPVEGYVVLAADQGVGGATVEALDDRGNVLGTVHQDVKLRAAPTPGFQTQRQPLFIRDAGDIVIRAFVYTCPGCANATLHVELSRQGAVGVGGNAAVSSDGIEWAGSGQFGQEEGVPAQWVGVRVPEDTGAVQARFTSGGSDEMAPMSGWAVLAVPGFTMVPSPHPGTVATPFVTVDAIDHSGNIRATEAF